MSVCLSNFEFSIMLQYIKQSFKWITGVIGTLIPKMISFTTNTWGRCICPTTFKVLDDGSRVLLELESECRNWSILGDIQKVVREHIVYCICKQDGSSWILGRKERFMNIGSSILLDLGVIQLTTETFHYKTSATFPYMYDIGMIFLYKNIA